MLYYCQFLLLKSVSPSPEICVSICRTMLYYLLSIPPPEICVTICRTMLYYCQFLLLKSVSPSVGKCCITVNSSSINMCHHLSDNVVLLSIPRPEICVPICRTMLYYCQSLLLKSVSPSVGQCCITVNPSS